MAVNLNECLISGTVVGDPMFSGEGDGSWGFVQVHTTYPQMDSGGQYKDVDQIVQCVSDMDRHTNTLRKYVKNGKALTLSTYYRTWEADGVQNHGLFIRKLTFASANFGQENNYNN